MACPHGNGPPEKCSQCVGAALVKRVELVAGDVIVDGVAVGTTKEHSTNADGSMYTHPGRRRGPSSPRRCRRCGQLGHIASSPKCGRAG